MSVQYCMANHENPTVIDSTTVHEISPLISTSDDTLVSSDQSEGARDPNNGAIEHNKVERGQCTLSDQYESLDYELCENSLLHEEDKTMNYRSYVGKELCRWLIMGLIGICTGLTASVVDISIESLSELKYMVLKWSVDDCVETLSDCLMTPLGIWLSINAAAVLTAALLTVYIEPVALGSGISQVKCYLNGVKIPKIVRAKTMFVKVTGVILSVVGGLAVGKEGPMIHTGAVIAAGISQGKSTTFKKDLKVFESFRTDQEKRDFVSGGAAAGVSAAFGAPVGGVLFSLEEGASFWNQALTWKIFFCSMTSTVCLNIVLSTYHGHPGQLAYSGLLNFGQFPNITYGFQEVPLFLLIGVIGGLLGALFNHINYKLSVFRLRHIYHKSHKVIEAVLLALITTTVGFMMIYFLNDCKTLGKDPNKSSVQFYCGDGEYNALAAIWFQTPEASVRSLFHDPPGSHQPMSIGLFFVVYFLISCWTYGLSVPSGLFIPTLLTGAAWGRMIGMLMEYMFPDESWVDPGKYALVGAAAQLGGVVRMTLSLSVILIEATGNITFGLPLMIVLIVAKWVADFFNEGIYDIHINLAGVPFLAWEPPPLSNNIYASEIMSHPVTVFQSVEKVENIVRTLQQHSHNGFPVVDASPNEETEKAFGHFRGLILRSQLIVLLQHKLFNETAENPDGWNYERPTRKSFRASYPTYPTIEEINISPEEMSYTIDLRPYYNSSPYTVLYCATLPRIFKLFRALGLRHLVVVNDTYEVVGMVTRKDLACFRLTHNEGLVGLNKLNISRG